MATISKSNQIKKLYLLGIDIGLNEFADFDQLAPVRGFKTAGANEIKRCFLRHFLQGILKREVSLYN